MQHENHNFPKSTRNFLFCSIPRYNLTNYEKCYRKSIEKPNNVPAKQNTSQ
ncbi:Uncharacterized protein APZ42_034323 [Daphnia magna]|uniref:Uncharacterized protein n=1 Tax=Daphnia magna TaxID=35525 RepID=A0A164K8D4_9CRUS|nr:Uncharacterized protein APZ42_034323 [Daphnia magna]